jgi:hypothetical protein
LRLDSRVDASDARIVRNAVGIDAVNSSLVVRRSRIAGNTVAGFTLSGRLTRATISDSSVLNDGNGPLSSALGANDVGRLRIERSTACRPSRAAASPARSSPTARRRTARAASRRVATT